MIVTVPKGRRIVPRCPKRVRGKIRFYIRLDETAIYDHGDGDQFDWNKLFGAKKKFFKPKQDSVMVGWRWHLGLQKFQLTPYIHKNGFIEYGSHVITAELNEMFEAEIDLEDKAFRIWTQNGVIDRSLDIDWSNGWLILHQFGGNRKTTQCIKTEFIRIP